MACMDAIIGKDHFGGFALQALRGEGGQAFLQLATGIGDGHPVEVGTRRGGGGGGVGHFVGAGIHQSNPVFGKPEFLHRDRENLAVETLTHFGAAVVHLHRAIRVDENEGTGLVIVLKGKADPEFDRSDGQTTALLGMVLVPSVQLLFASCEVGGF